MAKCSKCNKSFDEKKIAGICPYCGNEGFVKREDINEGRVKKEYRFGEWVDVVDTQKKEEHRSPIDRIAEDIKIIRIWVQVFGIATVVGWFFAFVYFIN